MSEIRKIEVKMEPKGLDMEIDKMEGSFVSERDMDKDMAGHDMIIEF